MGYPEVADVTAYLEEVGITATSGRTTRALASAISQWEKGTGFVPFLANDTPSERTFTLTQTWLEQAARSRLFDLGGGLVPSQSITIVRDGATLVEGEDWWPMPESARYGEEPYTLVRFRTACRTDYHGLSITGCWGYCLEDDLPEDVFGAIAQQAAVVAGSPLLAAASTSAPTGALVSVKEGDVERKWAADKDPLTSARVLASWAEQFTDTLARYKLPTFS